MLANKIFRLQSGDKPSKFVGKIRSDAPIGVANSMPTKDAMKQRRRRFVGTDNVELVEDLKQFEIPAPLQTIYDFPSNVATDKETIQFLLEDTGKGADRILIFGTDM
jgi:hypothetical protein